MSPHLSKLPVEAVAARLRAAGDAEAAALVESLRDALHRQDEALRDLVADARDISESVEEDGSYVDISCAQNGFDELLAAFGYESLEGRDPAELERARRSPGGPEAYDGVVFLSPLDHFHARIHTEGGDPAQLVELGLTPVQVRLPGGKEETLYVDRRPAPGPGPSP